ncbi:MAG TPA: MmcQ/YjbR family DNA-binding protein [Terriglobales bacterium]|nr:MmcQ/YjbR family DNA-binding protein [Terriglobales bacterium]
MTQDDFRRLALALPETTEQEHMRHPDFRVAGKIFATLAYPNDEFGMVKLTPEQQQEFLARDGKAFVPVPGAWGRQGCTHVTLKAAKVTVVRQAIALAWQNAAQQAKAAGKSGRRK